MADEIQIVAVMPGGGFESLGLVEVENLDAVMACLATLDTRGGHQVSLIDIKQAFERGKAIVAAMDVHRRRLYGSGSNNDAEQDGA